MDGDARDIPDVAIGRIPVHTIAEANNAIDKIIEYEKTPPTMAGFYNQASHACYYDGFWGDDEVWTEKSRAVRTSEDIIEYMEDVNNSINIERIYWTPSVVRPTTWNNTLFADGGLIPDSLTKPTFPWNGSRHDIINAFNDGRFYILCDMHGDTVQWQNPQLTIYDMDSLHNEGKYPVVFSMSCETGAFHGSTDCMAEALLKKEKGGCVGIIAPTSNAVIGMTELFYANMIDAIWPSPGLRIHFHDDMDTTSVINEQVCELGRILNQGMTHARSITLENNTTIQPCYHNINDLHNQLFQCFGDPSMMIYTEKPTPITPTITVDNNIIHVDSNCGPARISFYSLGRDPDEQVISYYGSSVNFEMTEDDNLEIVIGVDKHNRIPYVCTYLNDDVVIQNETITENRNIIANTIRVGKNVDSSIPPGDVIINGANVVLRANQVELHPGTTIINSNFRIDNPN